MESSEQRALLTIALMAAYADGSNAESEQAALKRVAESLGSSDPDVAAVYRDVLFGKPSLEAVTSAIGDPALRQRAFDAATAICSADGAQTSAEAAFLDALAKALAIDPLQAGASRQDADAIAMLPIAGPDPVAGEPVAAAADGADLDAMIVNYATLNGALELLPQALASMAIIPLQMRMVYRIGKHHGYELDSGHVTDFLATVGVGLASQYVERFGRRLLGGLLGNLGGLLGALGSAGTGAAFSFATTWALGQVAKRYYAGGRRLDAAALKESFSGLTAEAQALQAKYLPAIQERARSLDLAGLLRQLRGG